MPFGPTSQFGASRFNPVPLANLGLGYCQQVSFTESIVLARPVHTQLQGANHSPNLLVIRYEIT